MDEVSVAKSVVICLESDEEKIYIPWTPDTIDFDGSETRVAEYEIVNKGLYQVPTGQNLRSVSWEGTFPGEDHVDNLPFLHEIGEEGIESPTKYIGYFEKWRKKGTLVKVLIYEDEENIATTPIFDVECIIGNYTATMAGGFGDINYNVTFTEYREITITAKETAKDPEKKKKIPKTHKVKSGETLHSISVKYWGNGKKKSSLYKWNKKVIEKAAKKHGKKSSKKGKYLYKGTVLNLHNPKK